MPDIEKYVGETFKSTLPAEDMVKIPEEYAALLKQHRSGNQRRSQYNNSGSRNKYRRR